LDLQLASSMKFLILLQVALWDDIQYMELTCIICFTIIWALQMLLINILPAINFYHV
jgi:hypothetical protein